MAIISVKVLGSPEIKTLDVSTVGEAKTALGLESNYQGSVNGDAKEDGFALSDQDLVTFAAKVKGGNK